MESAEGTRSRATRTTAPLKVDAALDELIADGAYFLGMTKKDLVAATVRTYLELRREEVPASMREKMRKLDHRSRRRSGEGTWFRRDVVTPG